MNTDVRLDDGPDKSWVSIDASALKVNGADLHLDSKQRRGGAKGSHRRALVHANGDRLVVNFNGDYTGGVSIRNARINLATLQQSRQLPKDGTIGDLIVTDSRTVIEGKHLGMQVTLWLCIGPSSAATVSGKSGSYWVPISHGKAVEGTI
ncbi:hypothetical protein [Pseudoxanthomonas suwonensis]|uniref:hypothetical protein n=1 Tax=Pseudoxanthomonas suwonensis TaxID=314722 RepID=UPI0011860C38|nr:hypothetical protein [Pseudoxanthomonas suwonensis]